MNEAQLSEEAQEEISSELLPNVEPEETAESEVTAESAEPEETVEQAESSPIQEDTVSGSNSLNRSKNQQQGNPAEPLPDVHTAAEPGQPADAEEAAESEETSPTQVATSPTNAALPIEDLEEEASALVHLSESLSRSEQHNDKFTQTFFKYMKALSDRRCGEIFNTKVDHEDKSLVFYRRSFELLQFVDVERSWT